jgi:hypothetical protein
MIIACMSIKKIIHGDNWSKMKQSKYHILFSVLIFSGKLFSQSISEKELIGSWKNDASHDDTTQLIFFKDHKVMVSYRWGTDVFPFELIKYGDEQIVIFKKTRGKNTIAIFTAYVRKINDKEIDFQELQIRNTEGWKDGEYWKTKKYRRQISKPEDIFN